MVYGSSHPAHWFSQANAFASPHRELHLPLKVDEMTLILFGTTHHHPSTREGCLVWVPMSVSSYRGPPPHHLLLSHPVSESEHTESLARANQGLQCAHVSFLGQSDQVQVLASLPILWIPWERVGGLSRKPPLLPSSVSAEEAWDCSMSREHDSRSTRVRV